MLRVAVVVLGVAAAATFAVTLLPELECSLRMRSM